MNVAATSRRELIDAPVIVAVNGGDVEVSKSIDDHALIGKVREGKEYGGSQPDSDPL